MIIADEDDAQKIKDPPVAFPTVRYPDRAASRRPFSPLPDYETSQALALGGLNDSQVTLCKSPPRRRIFDSRLWKAIVISLIAYIFLTLAIGVPIVVHKELENEQKYPPNSPNYAMSWPPKGPLYPGNDGNNSGPGQPGIYPVCENWTVVEYFDTAGAPFVVASTERNVSPTGQFSITSNASCDSEFGLVQGVFYTGINPNQSVQDAVLSVMMQASSPDVFSQSISCFAVAENFTDLSLYVPDNLTSANNILYNISLLFPQTATPSRIDSFSTFLPMFEQRFSSFGDIITFEKLSIQGPVSPVTVDFVRADRLLVDTSLEPVTGTFHVNTSLSISTILAPIDANISLYNDPNRPIPTIIGVHTGNGNLTTNITVFAPNNGLPPRPNFIADIRTFSGFLSANVSHDPMSPPTVMQLHAVNDLGSVNVGLDNLFAGTFQVSTKQSSASVTQGNTSVPDPWGSNNPRVMSVDFNSTSRSYGCIGWPDPGEPLLPWEVYQTGEVLVDSSLAPVSLYFLG